MWKEVRKVQPSHYIAMTIGCGLVVILGAWFAGICWKSQSRLGAGVLAVLAILAAVGGVATALQIGPARAKQAAHEARLHKQFEGDIEPLVAELKRLGFEPPGTRGFFDEVSYRFDGDGAVGEGSTGRVAVRNSRGKEIWINFQITSYGARLGCIDGDVFVTTTPYGARQLRATLGCV